jgi:hypothetical protein
MRRVGACCEGTDVMGRSCAVARGIDINKIYFSTPEKSSPVGRGPCPFFYVKNAPYQKWFKIPVGNSRKLSLYSMTV